MVFVELNKFARKILAFVSFSVVVFSSCNSENNSQIPNLESDSSTITETQIAEALKETLSRRFEEIMDSGALDARNFAIGSYVYEYVADKDGNEITILLDNGEKWFQIKEKYTIEEIEKIFSENFSKDYSDSIIEKYNDCMLKQDGALYCKFGDDNYIINIDNTEYHPYEMKILESNENSATVEVGYWNYGYNFDGTDNIKFSLVGGEWMFDGMA